MKLTDGQRATLLYNKIVSRPHWDEKDLLDILIANIADADRAGFDSGCQQAYKVAEQACQAKVDRWCALSANGYDFAKRERAGALEDGAQGCVNAIRALAAYANGRRSEP